MTTHTVLGLTLLVGALAQACGDATSTAAAEEKTSPLTGSSASAGQGAQSGGAPACHAIVNGAPLVAGEVVTGPMPTAQGGTIEPGTYFLVARRIHDDTRNPYVGASTIEISGTTMYIHATDSLFDLESTGSMATSGTEMTLTFACPFEGAGQSEAHPYSAGTCSA